MDRGLVGLWDGQVCQTEAVLPPSTTLASLLQEPAWVDQNLGVGRQTLRTTNVVSTSLGCASDGEGILFEESVKEEHNCPDRIT